MSTAPYSGSSLKRSATHFLFGKGVSALLNVVILLWLVRLLAVEEYGFYITLVAGMDLIMALASLGLPWVGVRYLPEFRLHASGEQLLRFVWQMVGWSFLFTAVVALLLFIFLPWLLVPLKLSSQLNVAKLYLLVFVFESLRQNIQDCVLSPLLQQGQAQLSQVVRNFGLLVFLVIVVILGTVNLQHVILAELVGTLLGTIVVVFGLRKYLHLNLSLPGTHGWKPPVWSEIISTARDMYFSYLIVLTYSQQVFIFLIQRFLGVEATALFGFLLNLHSQVIRYSPAFLFFGLIRPKLMASYVDEGGMEQLTRNANFVGKVSLFVMLPILIFAWLTGEELVHLLSDGKFTHAGNYLGGLLLIFIPFSQRQLLETIAVACGNSHLCFWGSVFGVISLFLGYWLLDSGYGLWGPIIAMVMSQMIFNTTLTLNLRWCTTYRPDIAGYVKLAAAAFLGCLLSFSILFIWLHADQFQSLFLGGFVAYFKGMFTNHSSTLPIHGWVGLIIALSITINSYILTAYCVKPFLPYEKNRLNQLFRRKIFIW